MLRVKKKKKITRVVFYLLSFFLSFFSMLWIDWWFFFLPPTFCVFLGQRRNFVQLLQVFINENLMRLSHWTDGRTDMQTVGRTDGRTVRRRAALFWATVSFCCCQSLIAKEHMNFSSRTVAEIRSPRSFLFDFINRDLFLFFSSLFLFTFSKAFHSVCRV